MFRGSGVQGFRGSGFRGSEVLGSSFVICYSLFIIRYSGFRGFPLKYPIGVCLAEFHPDETDERFHRAGGVNRGQDSEFNRMG
jgi:hypothetical protein